MAAENDAPALLSPRVLAPAAGMAVALSLAAVAIWRFAPGLLLAFALLLAWGAALLWGMARTARQQARGSERESEEARRLEEELARAEETPEAPPPPPLANVQSIIRDPLTGLFHRRYFEASLEREIHRMERHGLTFGIILMRVDQDETPDTHLRAIAALLNRRVRGSDVASRHEGGTFGLILSEAPLEGVRTRAEQIRAAVREIGGTTLSLGVAAFPECGHSSERLLNAVKTALEDARAGGGDRVAVAPGAVLDRRLMLPD